MNGTGSDNLGPWAPEFCEGASETGQDLGLDGPYFAPNTAARVDQGITPFFLDHGHARHPSNFFNHGQVYSDPFTPAGRYENAYPVSP